MFAKEKQQLGALEGRVNAAVSTLRADVTAQRTRLKSVEPEALKPLAASEQALLLAASTAVKQVAALRAKVQARGGAAAAGSRTARDINARIDAAEKTAKASLGAVGKQLVTSKGTITASAAQICNTAGATLDTVDRSIAGLETAVVGPLTEMKQRFAQTEAQLNTIVTEATQALDALEQRALGQIRQFISQLQAVIDTASTSLASVRVTIDGLPGTVLPAIKALKALLQELQTAFTTGAQALNTALNSAKSAVDAVPVASLPKALVTPTQSAIESALSAATTAIQSAARTAGSQLGTLSGQVQAQIDTAKTQGLAQVDAFVATISSQISAILPVADAQLSTIQQSITRLIQQLGAQIDAANTVVIRQLASLKSQLSQAVSTSLTSASSELDSATARVRQATAGSRTQIDAAVAALAARAASAAASLDTQTRAASESAANALAPIAQSLQ